ncbi:hypothetical protein N431DRAFT_477937 [Stipitochalara longipes BDJ]|nr:hypothetical protein N431DRAFT_477937 [Stipitochalara longipes BDJ]
MEFPNCYVYRIFPLHFSVIDQAYLKESRTSGILAIAAIFPVLALFTVLLRLYTRLLVINNASRDDLYIGFAVVCSLGVSITIFFEVRFGFGKHLTVAIPSNIPHYFKSLFASIFLYTIGILFNKLSILEQYIRISAPGRTRKAIYAVKVMVFLSALATLLSCIFSCYSVAYFWDASIPGGRCLNEEALYLANGSLNIDIDLLTLIIAIFLLKDLSMPRPQKIFLIGILSLGGAIHLPLTHAPHLFRTSDFFWNGPGAAEWSVIELNVGIICASISTLRPLLSPFHSRAFSSCYRSPQAYQPSPYLSSNVVISRGGMHRLDTMDAQDEWGLDNGRGWLCKRAEGVVIRVEREFRVENVGV